MNWKNYVLYLIFLAFATTVCCMVWGCAPARREQPDKQKQIDRILEDFQWSLRNEFDRNNMRNLRYQVKGILTE